MGMVFGYFIAISFPSVSLSKVYVRVYYLMFVNKLYVLHQIYVDHLICCNMLQINLPSNLISSFDVSIYERADHRKYMMRSFPENLGSGNTPITPKVLFH